MHNDHELGPVARRLSATQRVLCVEGDPAFTQPTGIDAFVSKPFNTDVLAELVRHRMDVAAELAERGRHQDLELMTQAYVEARLTDEMAVADMNGRLSFALVRLVSMDAVIAEVGVSGRDHVVDRIVRAGGDALPPDAVLGLMETDEIAVILPDCDVDSAEELLRPVLEALGGVFAFPGGANVPVHLACGVASYPEHAADVDGLFMAADAALTDAVESATLIRQAL